MEKTLMDNYRKFEENYNCNKNNDDLIEFGLKIMSQMNSLSIFSQNETYDELLTSSIEYK